MSLVLDYPFEIGICVLKGECALILLIINEIQRPFGPITHLMYSGFVKRKVEVSGSCKVEMSKLPFRR
jgi:hypothetical protein